MKASELRLGNWVILSVAGTRHYGRIHTLTPTHLLIGDGIKCDYSDLEPVPLTKEILSKAWFEYEDGDFIKGLWKLVADYQIGKIVGYGLFVKLLDWTRTNQNSIKYLHQLQNLFFAINGEELIID